MNTDIRALEEAVGEAEQRVQEAEAADALPVQVAEERHRLTAARARYEDVAGHPIQQDEPATQLFSESRAGEWY